LADEVALSKCFGFPIQTQPDPETFENAKDAVSAMRDRGTSSDSLADCYARLSSIANLDLMERRCPKGFAVWMKRLAAL